MRYHTVAIANRHKKVKEDHRLSERKMPVNPTKLFHQDAQTMPNESEKVNSE